MSVRTQIGAMHHCKSPLLLAIAVLSAAALSSLPPDALAASTTVTASAADAWAPAPRLTADDRRFVDDAIVDHLGSLALARLAQQHGGPSVSDYGRRLEREQKAAITRLVGLRPPASTPSRVAELDAAQKAMLARLDGLDGEQFDRRFIELVQQKHLADLQHLQLAVDDRRYSDHVRNVAAQLAPDAQQHVQLAAQLGDDERIASTPED